MADAPAPGRLNREALNKAIDSLNLQDIALRGCSVDVDKHSILGIDEKKLQVQLKWGTKEASVVEARKKDEPDSQRLFIVEVGLTLRLVDTPTDGSDAGEAVPHRALIDTAFLATYRVMNMEVEPQALDEFANQNVVYHVWPYWREFLSSILARARLPPFTLPMYVLQPVKPSAERPSKEASES